MESTNLKLAENNLKLSEAIAQLTEKKGVVNRKIQSMKKITQSQAQPLTFKYGYNLEIIPSGLVCSSSKECLNKLASEFSFKKIENAVQCNANQYCLSTHCEPPVIPIINTPHVHQKSSSVVGKRNRKWTHESIATFNNVKDIKRASQKGTTLNQPFSISSAKKPNSRLMITVKTINCNSTKLNFQKLATLEIQPKIIFSVQESMSKESRIICNQSIASIHIPLNLKYKTIAGNNLAGRSNKITRRMSEAYIPTTAKDSSIQIRERPWNIKSIALLVGVELLALLLYRLTQ